VRIAVLGTGYVGLVVGACLAESGNTVICADIDEKKIRHLTKGKNPIYEPGLDRLLARNLSEERLRFSTDIGDSIQSSEIIFIAVGTPSDTDGSTDLKYVTSVAEVIGDNLNNEKIIITKSTVPVGTALKVKEIIAERIHQKCHICANPEFLKEGTAVEDFMRPDRIVIGIETGDDHTRAVLEELYSPFIRAGDSIIFTDTTSAEMIKYTSNTMLAVRISFMNQIAALCEQVGADVEVVRKGVGADPRIGHSFLLAGAGYGGSCFPKDVRSIVKTGEQYGLDMSIPRAANEWNEEQKRVAVGKLVDELGNDLSGRIVAVWGLSFKPGTDDIREAPSLVVIPELLSLGAAVRVHDPQAIQTAREILPPEVDFINDEYDACTKADALVILTEWQQYRRPDLRRIHDLMASPLIIDGRNIFSLSMMQERGFIYHSIGRAVVRPK